MPASFCPSPINSPFTAGFKLHHKASGSPAIIVSSLTKSERSRLASARARAGVRTSKLLRDPPPSPIHRGPQQPPTIRVVAADTLQAAFPLCTDGRGAVALLSMASKLRPGGGFFSGASAQEESLCLRRTLYAGLHDSFYILPEREAVYTLDVPAAAWWFGLIAWVDIIGLIIVYGYLLIQVALILLCILITMICRIVGGVLLAAWLDVLHHVLCLHAKRSFPAVLILDDHLSRLDVSGLLSLSHVNGFGRGMLSPMNVNDLPVELVTKALRYVVFGPYINRDPAYRRDAVVSHVCVYWRDIVLMNTIFWSIVCVDNYTPLIDLHCSLSRSRESPLAVRLVFHSEPDPDRGGAYSPREEYFQWLLATIGPHLIRARRLSVYSPHHVDTMRVCAYLRTLDCPILTDLELVVTTPPMSFQRAHIGDRVRQKVPMVLDARFPGLQTLSISATLPVWDWAARLSSLTSVRLSRFLYSRAPTIGEFHAFFNATSRLVHLHLDAIVCAAFSDIFATRPVLRCLTHLDLVVSSQYDEVFVLASMHFPALRTLALRIEEAPDIVHFWGRCATVVASVTTAVLDVDFVNRTQLMELLSMMPNLSAVGIPAPGTSIGASEMTDAVDVAFPLSAAISRLLASDKPVQWSGLPHWLLLFVVQQRS
ncbi:hypothetical protein B0H17DRAFT_1190127 [Mycena rosella]|uniref:Microbial-type PARG catalytic domain-containing protein n=1 Tax=Mycena rosella TaxID=1033263 RepID=A0AAD7MCQ8_MYCRO|nr:hypothetical protein B0H17DRAFT_1190127 [Mycena rosella]